MLNKLKQILNLMNKAGIPIPLLRDPKSGTGSITYTFLWISGNVVLLGLIGKFSHFLDGVDIQQSIYFFMVCAGLYFGRTASLPSGASLKNDNTEGNNNNA